MDGTVLVEGDPVDPEDFHFPDEGYGRDMYSFAVPDSDMYCSILPAEDDGRGWVGCQGTVEPGITVEGSAGPQSQANGVILREDGPYFVEVTDVSYIPIDPDGGGMADVPTLDNGQMLTVFGVSCRTADGPTVECTAGDASMIVNPEWHEFSD
jgi:hypothetical protein